MSTAGEMGWSEIDNGSLLSAAETILVLPTTNWRHIQNYQDRILAAINELRPGDLIELRF